MFGFVTPLGSVSVHVKLFVAPAVALNVPVNDHVMLADAKFAGFVVIATVDGNAEITSPCVVTALVIWKFAGGGVTVANVIIGV